MDATKLIEILKKVSTQIGTLTNSETDIRRLHHERSKHFVELLSQGFRDYYSDNSNCKIFSKQYYGNREEFGINEYQYDILVCEIDSVISAKQQKKLSFIKKAIWLVESEFARNTREAIKDFNKLVVGNSKYKLFIGPLNSVNEAYINTLLPSAKCCNGQVYISLFSHPRYWNKSKIDFIVWKLNEKWDKIYSFENQPLTIDDP